MDISRRRFLAGRKPGPLAFRPPWSVSEAAFVDCCTACDDCVKACPTGLLVRAEDGLPVADFAAAACTFCGDCAAVCDSGAITRTGEQNPWHFGIAISNACLAARQVECRVCGEACDTGAIRFRPRSGGIALPHIDNAACNGCGACIAPCPANAVRRLALPQPAAISSTPPTLELS